MKLANSIRLAESDIEIVNSIRSRIGGNKRTDAFLEQGVEPPCLQVIPEEQPMILQAAANADIYQPKWLPQDAFLAYPLREQRQVWMSMSQWYPQDFGRVASAYNLLSLAYARCIYIAREGA